MDRHSEDKLSAYLKVRQFFIDNLANCAAIVPVLNTIHADFLLALQNLLDTKEDADLDITGYTEDKKKKRATLEIACIKIAKSLSLYAQINELISLKEKVNFTASEFTRMRDTEIYTTARKIEELVQPYQIDMGNYGISNADISQFAVYIKSFFDVIQAPKYKIGERASLNHNLSSYMSHMDTLLREQMDVAMAIVGISNSALQEQYLSARSIDDTSGGSGIRTHSDSVEAQSTRTVTDLSYQPDLTFTFQNKGNTNLVFGLSTDGTTFVGTSIAVNPSDTLTRDASDLAPEGVYLLVQNMGNNIGYYAVIVD